MPLDPARPPFHPVDGRYARALRTAARHHLSEQGLIRERIRIEAQWLLHLAGAGDAFRRTARHRASRARQRAPQLAAGFDAAPPRSRRSSAHQPRRQGGRVLRPAKLLSPLAPMPRRSSWCTSLHLRGHQQPCLRADAAVGAPLDALQTRSTPAARARCARSRIAMPTTADARAHARPDREPDDARQGNRQRRRPAAARARPGGGRRAAGEDERRGRQLQRACRRGSRRRTGSRSPPLRRVAGPRLERPHHADRTARLDRRVLRCARRRQRDPHRPVARHLGLREHRLPAAAPGGWRGRFIDHASQGQPDRLRERRRQPRPRQRAAAPLLPRSCRSRAGSATSRTRPCCATSVSRWHIH